MLLKKFKQTIFNHYKKQESQSHLLSYLFWECTQRCNLHCLHCGSDCSQNAIVQDMPATDFLKVLDDINSMEHDPATTVVITGGEPLLRKDLEKCGQEIRKRNFRWGIVTNGYAYTPERHNSLLNAGMGSCTLSFDGMEENHNWLRNNPNSFDHAIQAMRLMANEERLNFDVVTCVNKKNLHELESIRQILIENKVKAWRLFTITPIGRAAGNKSLQLDRTEFTELMKYIENAKKDHSVAVNFSCEGYLGKYEIRARDSFFFCRGGIHIGSVLYNGDISACPNMDRSFAQGNIYQDKFSEIWNNRFELFRNRAWTKTGICAHCKSYKTCQGNGLHYWTAKKDGVLMCHSQLIDE